MSRAFRATSVWFLSTLSFFLVGVLAKADGLETTLEVKPNEVILALPDFKDYYRITQGKLLNVPTGQCDTEGQTAGQQYKVPGGGGRNGTGHRAAVRDQRGK